MNDTSAIAAMNLSEQLVERVLAPIKAEFVGKDDIVDLMGVCLVGGEHLFLFGPPGTAKSALVQRMGQRLRGDVFDYLLTRFTEPNELFGPFDIRRLREGELVTNTAGMLPEAALVFLDELLNANSAILNSLLMVLNERVFRRGRETRPLPLLMAVGASNHLPEDEALRALFDRFLVRVRCDNVAQEQLTAVLHAGWVLERRHGDDERTMSVDDIRALQQLVAEVNVEAIRSEYVELIHRLRHAGILVSDRRAVKFQRLIAASAVLCGRMQAEVSDLWVVRHTWDTEEQEEIIRTLVQHVIDAAADAEDGPRHPQSRAGHAPDAEALAVDLRRIAERLDGADQLPDADSRYLRDRLSLLTGRCEWVTDDTQRTQLQQLTDELWQKLGAD
ncbi:MAG: AAA family ATPase [Planctomycetaceae bacterium]|jgi:MoxR-like ATPase